MKSQCLAVSSDSRLNFLVQSKRYHITFHLNSRSTKFSSEYPKKMEEKKLTKKILPPICDPIKRYPVEIKSIPFPNSRARLHSKRRNFIDKTTFHPIQAYKSVLTTQEEKEEEEEEEEEKHQSSSDSDHLNGPTHQFECVKKKIK